MPKVVSNSSPLIHLAKINRLDLLKSYFQNVIISEAVYRECVVDGKDRHDVELIKKADWIKLFKIKDQRLTRILQTQLDFGESETIVLSLEIGADLILLDDYDARQKARLFGLKITGTLGILLRAKIDGKIKILKEEIEKLKLNGFRSSAGMLSISIPR